MPEELPTNELLLALQRVTAELKEPRRPEDAARLQTVRNRLVVTLMERYGGAFRRVCQNHFRLPFADADDVTQETFIKIVNGIASFDPNGRAEGWIFRILHNTALDLLRRQRDLRQLSLSDEQLAVIEQISDDDLDEFFDFDDARKHALATARCLVVAVEGLSEDDRNALKKGPPKRGPESTALMAAWLQLRLGIVDCLVASEEGHG